MTDGQASELDASRPALGIDVGGTGVKAALVDTVNGRLIGERVRLKTPVPATPDAVAATVRQVVDKIGERHAIPANVPAGCGLPGVVKDGRVMTVANIDEGWLRVSAEEVLGQALGREVTTINDADAAGIAEMRLGAGRGQRGTVLLLTIGTGIGSALFTDGRLVRNTELGHLEYRGFEAEKMLSGVIREKRGLTWLEWATEFNGYIARLEAYFWPDLLIFGGGVSKAMDKYRANLRSRAPIVAAAFLNTAGIVGAALGAIERREPADRPATASPSVAAASPAPPSAAGPAATPTSSRRAPGA